MKLNNDIPIEGAVKWLLKDRDKYKAKLEQLIPYTKSIEKQNIELQTWLLDIKKRNRELSKEITTSAPYKALLKRYQALEKANKQLLSRLSVLISQDYEPNNP